MPLPPAPTKKASRVALAEHAIQTLADSPIGQSKAAAPATLDTAAFNTIWRVRKSRRGVSSFLLYWAILSLGPLLLGSGFAISTYLTSTSLLSGPDAVAGAKTLLSFTPLLFSVAAFTLIAMNAALIVVFLSILFMGGLVERLFREFSITLAGAMLISLFISLTLTPSLSALLLQKQQAKAATQSQKTTLFHSFAHKYQRSLGWVLQYKRNTNDSQ